MATLKPILKDRRKDGNYSLKILLVHNQKNAYINTDYHIQRNQLRNSRITNHPNANIMNKRISTLIHEYEIKMDEIAYKIHDLTALEIKEFLISKEEKKDIDLIFYIDGIISDLKSRYRKKLLTEGKASKRTFETYRTLKNHLKEFANEPILVRMIDRSFLERFEDYLRSQGINSGVWNYMKDLRTIVNKLIADGKMKDYPFKFYNIGKLKKQSEPKVLEVDVLKEILSCSSYELDIFKLGFYMIGINAVDLYHLENGGGSIKEGRMYFDRSKTDVIHSIKIEPEADELINKLRGNDKYFSFQEKYCDTSGFTKYVNKGLKRICIKNKWPVFTLGYARYTWATIAFNDCDISESVIDFALGHKSKSLAGAHYIKKRRIHMDAANRKVIDFLLPFE